MSERIPQATAIRTAAKNKFGKWPGREAENRLEPFARPHATTTFNLAPGDKVFTIGSCFARNIEEYMGHYGFRVPVLEYRGEAEETLSGRDQGILNKYTPASIIQEFEWVRDVRNFGGVVTWHNVAPLVVETAPDRFLDLHLASKVSVSKERAIQRRADIYAIHSHAFDADLVVITPGVTECWFDTHSQLYIQQMPPMAEDRFEFHNLDYSMCRDMLSRAADLVLSAGARRVLMTVSPVPLGRTFTESDVLIANAYSKSVLRAAVGSICESNPELSYFPSYEMVTLTKNPNVWKDDLAHVADSFVGQIVQHLMATVTNIAPDREKDEILAFNIAFAEGDVVKCQDIYQRLGLLAHQPGLLEFHRTAFRFLMQSGKPRDAVIHAQLCQRQLPGRATGYLMEARALLRAGDHAGALTIIDQGAANAVRSEQLLKLRERLVGEVMV